MILLYGGTMAVVVGVLTNSYFGNIFSAYFPNASVTKILESIAVINPTSPQGSVTVYHYFYCNCLLHR